MKPDDSIIILLGFGAPETIDDVAGFMKNLTGREVPLERLAGIQDKYRQIGGGSPLLRIAREQALSLEAELAQRDYPYKVAVGMRYMEPFIEDVVKIWAQQGFNKFLGVSLSPQHSRVTTGAYLQRFAEAVAENGCSGIEIYDWSKNRSYLEALAETIEEARQTAGPNAPIVFSAHSVPREHVETGDTYLEEIERIIDGLEEQMGEFRHYLAFQSRGGPGSWLEPTTDDVIEELAAEGTESMVIVAISFISDHMESLYDIDIVYKKKAEELGLRLVRARSLNDSPGLISAMADSVIEQIDTGI